MKAVNHYKRWSASELETLKSLGPKKSYVILGRKLGACVAQFYLMTGHYSFDLYIIKGINYKLKKESDTRILAAETVIPEPPAFIPIPLEAFEPSDVLDKQLVTEGEINYPDRIPSPNTPYKAPSWLERILDKVSKW